MILAFNKPYGVLSQFTDAEGRPTLSAFINVPDVYAAGRLDLDSEGLLVLTDEPDVKTAIADPRYRLSKQYLLQVEGTPTLKHLRSMERGVKLKDGHAKADHVELLSGKPGWVWTRTPPIRVRAKQPTHWLTVTVSEGRNRMVRRMSAAVGLPTLRLIRIAVGKLQLRQLRPTELREVPVQSLGLSGRV